MTWDERLSCLVNAFLGGYACETLCSRIWLCSLSDPRAQACVFVLDMLFAWKEREHCWQAHLRYLRRLRM